MPYPRFASLLAAALALAAPAAASAQLSICTLTGAIGATPVLDCAPVFCTDAVSCPAERFERPVCDVVGSATDVVRCRSECGSLYGCQTDADCPPFLGRTGVCSRLADPPGGLSGGVCTYPTAGATYCPDSEGSRGREQVFDCHVTPGGRPTSNWLAGDCDEDGCPNGLDPDPCEDTARELCGTVRRGDGVCVPEVPGGGARDAGVPDAGGVDAGERSDGGEGPRDGGEDPRDGGEGPRDGGEDELDGGASEPFDAGAAAPPGVQFNGGGGCRCSAPGGGGSGAAGVLALVALLGALRWRETRNGR